MRADSRKSPGEGLPGPVAGGLGRPSLGKVAYLMQGPSQMDLPVSGLSVSVNDEPLCVVTTTAIGAPGLPQLTMAIVVGGFLSGM
jgi:hypothetical protein